jgi:ADP-ribose pyrophosphatase YjhB (NUDIX family)
MTDDDQMRRVMRYCTKCGAAALRFVGRKCVHCDVCGFDLYLNTAAAVAALIPDDQGRLLIIERAEEPKQGTWDLPGGFADPGETAEEALRREVEEELGLRVVSTRYLCSHPNTYEFQGMRYATMDLGFICRVEDTESAKIAKSEVRQLLTVPLADIDIARFGFASVGKIIAYYRTIIATDESP